MPKPIILLENHLRPYARRFVADHVVSLKKLGYTKFLLEMNSEISKDRFKSESQQILERIDCPKESSEYLSYKAMVDLIAALEKNQIPYDFIDPETRSEAERWNLLLRSVKTDTERAIGILARRRATECRDLKMAQIIKKEADLNEGGIIVLIGYAHSTLLHLLKEFDKKHIYSPIILNDTSVCGYDHWLSLQHKEKREQFYKTHVHFIDMYESPSFDMIEKRCELLDHKSCRQVPLIGEYFNRVMERAFTYSIDETYALSASAEVTTATDALAITAKMSARCPGLRFFERSEAGKIRFDVPGLNLPENREKLETTFRSFGIMARYSLSKG